MKTIQEILNQYQNGTLNPMSHEEWVKVTIASHNALVPMEPLPNYDCPICKNKGSVAYERDGEVAFKDCECLKIRANIRRIEKSGLKDLLNEYTFDKFVPQEEWQKKAKGSCVEYTNDPKGWLVFTGTPGTGKTHLCTAVCGEFIKQGKSVRYLLWRTDGPVLKASANTEEYADKVKPYKTCDVLYIDDLFKGKITDADVNLAFDLLNARYMSFKPTLISTELSLEKIMDIDQALGSRIYQRKAYLIDTNGKKNWRMR